MPKEFGRNRRIADLIQRELAVLIQRELDPGRFGMVTVSAVDVSPDLAHARIYFTSLGTTLAPAALTSELNAVAGRFRRHLAGNLTLRGVPRLQFVFDESVARGSRISALIDSIGRVADDE